MPQIEVCYQHPRYTIHERQQPCSVYMGYDFTTGVTTYLIFSGEADPWVGRAKKRFADYCTEWVPRMSNDSTDDKTTSSEAVAFPASETRDPFLLQSMLCHESLVEARRPITELRHRLYDVLDVVGEYAKEPFDRSNLKDITNKLHGISQDVDSLYVSAEMGSMVARHCATAREAILDERRKQQVEQSGTLSGDESAVSQPPTPGLDFVSTPGLDELPSPGHSDVTLAASADDTPKVCTPNPHDFEGSNVGDALAYLIQSLDSQKRWLQSYKSRKDIAMNLVFNLVTQQDAETSTSIARDTKADSSSMKTIAVLTMVFLPATTVSSFFGMAFFNLSEQGNFMASTSVWMFVAVTAPLTAITFVLWLYWWHIVAFLGKRKQLRGEKGAHTV